MTRQTTPKKESVAAEIGFDDALRTSAAGGRLQRVLSVEHAPDTSPGSSARMERS